MAGISSSAASFLKNKIGITGKEMQSNEFESGASLELYDFGARFQDPQIGRWSVTDPLTASYYSLSPYNFCNNNPLRFIDPNGMEFKDTLGGRYDYGDLKNVSVTNRKKENNSLANRAFAWANEAAKPEAKLWVKRKDVYQTARFNGWSEKTMRENWGKRGISEADLARFERYYRSEVDYRNMSLGAVAIMGAPLLLSTTSLATLTTLTQGTFAMRSASAASDFTIQYAVNIGKGHGFGLDNLGNINASSIAGNFLMPNNPLGSSIMGSGLALNFNGTYSGVSGSAFGSQIVVNVGLGYMGNVIAGGFGNMYVGRGAGEFFGNYTGNNFGNIISGTGQFITEQFYTEK